MAAFSARSKIAQQCLASSPPSRYTRYQADATPYLGRSFTGWITLPGAQKVGLT